MDFFSICAKNFLPSADILYKSLRRTNPNSTFTLYICDRQLGFDPDDFEFPIYRLEALGIPDLGSMIKSYNITELCTSIKPYCFLHQFDVLNNDFVVYLDPDIEVFGPFQEVWTGLESGAQAVLTPHITRTAEFSEHTDQQFLRLGIYNLGFLGCRRTDPIREYMNWWGRRLASQCVIDIENGVFVDQKWADLLPAFVENVQILRHPGYNVAYWNLPERRIHQKNGEWFVNKEKLRFLHYSGIFRDQSGMLSRHSKVYHINNSFGYGDLVRRYRKLLAEPKYERYGSLPFSFFWEPNGVVNAHAPGQLYGHQHWRQPGTYLDVKQFFNRNEYEAYMTSHADDIQSQQAQAARIIEDGKDLCNVTGFCYPCGGQRKLVFESNQHDDCTPHNLSCKCCTMSNVGRGLLHVFVQELDPARDASIYLTEQDTPLFMWLTERFTKVVGSRYLGQNYTEGQVVKGLRHEDPESLSFSGARFGFVLSPGNMGFVKDVQKAFAEVFRCLKPGGYFMFTAPCDMSSPIHLAPTILDAAGLVDSDCRAVVLPERVLGWQILDDLLEAGFVTPFVYHYWSLNFGYTGSDQFVFVAQKPEA